MNVYLKNWKLKNYWLKIEQGVQKQNQMSIQISELLKSNF